MSFAVEERGKPNTLDYQMFFSKCGSVNWLLYVHAALFGLFCNLRAYSIVAILYVDSCITHLEV